MKVFVFMNLFALLLVAGCGSGSGNINFDSVNSLTDTGKAVIVFKEYEHSFGKVEEGEKVGYIFRFENQGTGNLVIQNAITSCGCTVPKYDRKPISPGRSGNLEVIFDTSGRSGLQAKTITVKSNATVPVILLKITADVQLKK
ncbi:MAG TPA: DUF1573 domain-containing protein [Bacteroidales bacterium]|nr:DUF1573 domain-containing protein [Bacteroidales bacterium]